MSLSVSKFKKIRTYIILVVGLLIFCLPFLYMIIASTQNNAEITSIPPYLLPSIYARENVQKLNEKYFFWMSFKNTMIVTIVGTILSTSFTTMAGYAFAKFKFKGKNVLFKLLLFTSMVPVFSTILPLFIIFSKTGLLNTYASLIVPGLAGASTIFMMRQYMYSVPDEILESARIDGASEASIFIKVVVPMSVPSIVTGALTIFIGYWNSYIWPLVSITNADKQILPLVIRNMGLVHDELLYGVRYMGLVLSVIPIIIFYILIQRKLTNTGISSAIK